MNKYLELATAPSTTLKEMLSRDCFILKDFGINGLTEYIEVEKDTKEIAGSTFFGTNFEVVSLAPRILDKTRIAWIGVSYHTNTVFWWLEGYV